MRIVVVALGSRGEVQPFLNLGVGLSVKGHDVQMAVPENFMELVKEHGLGFVSIRGDFKKILSSTEGRKFLKSKKNRQEIKPMRTRGTTLQKPIRCSKCRHWRRWRNSCGLGYFTKADSAPCKQAITKRGVRL